MITHPSAAPDLSAAPAPIRIAVLSSADGGGGGLAAHRMATALNTQPGVQADFLSRRELGGILPPEVAPPRSMSNRQMTNTHFTVEYPGYRRDWLIDLLAGYDIVNVHWASFLLGLAELDALARRGTPMLFMLHDFHYMTGGCHYPAECNKLVLGCHGCPQVDSARCDSRFIPINLRVKRGIFARPNVHLAAPSRYLRDRAVASGLIPEARAHVLRNPYEPLPDPAPHPADGQVRILLIADSLVERRKALPLALDSLDLLQRRIDAGATPQRMRIDVVGTADQALQDRLETGGLDYVLHGRITDHARLVQIFAENDILLSCSYEDNWPNILVEACSYGCVPVVGPGHGCQEFVTTYGIGAVAPRYEATAFADTLLATATRHDRTDPDARARIRADHRNEHVAHHFLQIAAAIAPGP
ncbi:glycosyltransferase [Sedimentitalea nanhaiensis]|uniref:Glycosyltransferase involved in cell wall bisynthesis n=1 Tax=Sedimentitalea nanhaiensis TaxID=999627 RepID=A0A1I7E1R4_9RHOB|nr:glycosyltransferase [Sedimentitalea nanhaiensis]SFU17881.1 Glycosyltransferase involved in cell wall bisynthesis [Sedimentitalea nanhaiensis]